MLGYFDTEVDVETLTSTQRRLGLRAGMEWKSSEDTALVFTTTRGGRGAQAVPPKGSGSPVHGGPGEAVPVSITGGIA